MYNQINLDQKKEGRDFSKIAAQKIETLTLSEGFLLHFQETTFGVITSRGGHEKGKCNDSASSVKGKSKIRNEIITIYIYIYIYI